MLFSRDKGSLILILDVQSSIVRGTLVRMMDKGSKPLILYTRNAPIPYKPHARSGYLIKTAIKAIEDSIEDILIHMHARRSQDKDFPHRISHVHYVLSSPWILSQAKSLSLSFPEPTTIDRAYISKLIEQNRQKLVSDAVEEARVIEEKIFDIRLNGYSVANWNKKSTTQLEVSFVASVAGARMVEKLTDACRHVGRRSHVSFHSSLFLQHIGMSSVARSLPSYGLVHIHGELTDVAIIHNGSCVFFGSYPFGIYSIIRTVSRETGMDPYTTESTLNLAAQGSLDPAHASKDAAIVTSVAARWASELRSLMKTSPTPDVMPSRVFLSAHSHEDLFMKQFVATYPGSKPQPLTHEDVATLVDYDPRTEKLRTTGLYAAAIHTLEG